MFINRILDFDRYRRIFRTELSFPKYRYYFHFGVTVSDKKYENGNDFSVYRSFLTVIIHMRDRVSLSYPTHVVEAASMCRVY
jgi:hypothetical protein